MNTQLKYLEKDFKIICALLNKYRVKVVENKPEDKKFNVWHLSIKTRKILYK
jgi:phosphopantothenoylcysteine synthetase/decarboxylase